MSLFDFPGSTRCRSRSSQRTIVIIIVFSSFLTGCATPYTKVYGGPELPSSEIAKIEAYESGRGLFHTPDWVLINSVDGKDVGGVHKIQVLPGTHRLLVRYQFETVGLLPYLLSEKLSPRSEKELVLEANAGHEYIIKFEKVYDSSRVLYNYKDVVYWVEDKKTGEIVSGQKPSDQPEPTADQ